MGKIAAALEKSGRQIDAPPVKVSSGEKIAEPKTIQPIKVPPPKAKTSAGGLHPSLVALSKNHAFATEQFKLLKTNLLFGKGEKSPRLIMVTSALPGEGKSFIAANLAVSIAQNLNEYVLLIDCDLRRPTIHKLFNLDSPHGLSEYLQDGQDVSKYMVKTAQDKLTLIPAGRGPDNPLELLTSQKMSQLLNEIKHRYSDRYVIIDAPPPHLTAESNALAKLVDSVLLVVKKGGTNRRMVSELVENIGREKIAGVVFNHFEMPKLSYYGYGKYANYGKYTNYSR